MAEIYGPPPEFTPPAFDLKYEEYAKECGKYVQSLKDWAKEKGNCPEAGKEIQFQVADGYARYIVFSLKPVRLIHIDTDDAYAFQYAHRLTAGDVRDEIKKLESLNAMFKRRT